MITELLFVIDPPLNISTLTMLDSMFIFEARDMAWYVATSSNHLRDGAIFQNNNSPQNPLPSFSKRSNNLNTDIKEICFYQCYGSGSLQIDSTSDCVFSTLNAGIGNLVWFWEVYRREDCEYLKPQPITHSFLCCEKFHSLLMTYCYLMVVLGGQNRWFWKDHKSLF